MPTPNERKALWFLAIVALSGGAVRVARPRQPPPASAEAEALERQLRRVDSARAARKEPRGSSRQRSGSRPAERRVDAGSKPASSEGGREATPPQPAIVDLDRASMEQIEGLPGIGPALAKRIVSHRDSAGSFGELDALCEVRGVGPKLAERLRPLVTFTGQRRPLSDACGSPGKTPRKRRGS